MVVVVLGGTSVQQEGGQSFKKSKEDKLKAASGNSFNWNTLFLRADTVADAMADAYGVSKSDILNSDNAGSTAVRMALGETHIIAENKEFLRDNSINLDAFDGRPKTKHTQ